MFSLIEKLQQASEERRKTVALTGALFVTGITFFLWALGVTTRFTGDTEQMVATATTEKSEKISPFSSFKRGVTDFIGGAGNQIQSMQEQLGL
jgi:hypothetical protein